MSDAATALSIIKKPSESNSKLAGPEQTWRMLAFLISTAMLIEMPTDMATNHWKRPNLDQMSEWNPTTPIYKKTGNASEIHRFRTCLFNLKTLT